MATLSCRLHPAQHPRVQHPPNRRIAHRARKNPPSLRKRPWLVAAAARLYAHQAHHGHRAHHHQPAAYSAANVPHRAGGGAGKPRRRAVHPKPHRARRARIYHLQIPQHGKKFRSARRAACPDWRRTSNPRGQIYPQNAAGRAAPVLEHFARRHEPHRPAPRAARVCRTI